MATRFPSKQLSVTEKIPEYLMQYVTDQDDSLYTPIDHAAWRYIMRVASRFFQTHAHPKYLEGIKLTGMATDRIPKISEMDQALRKFGWRAVAVSGFIPPAVFMEFQSLGVLPIACDMRTSEHIGYTPAPDIVHEAAGHAPILADPGYASYLRTYGEIAKYAIYSSKDMEVYEAIRNLSIVKEDPTAIGIDIEMAQERLNRATASSDYVSEATYLSRMFWWTVEYGLVGDPSKPLIYGAGLLSSVAESYHCLADKVAKIPFSLDCVNMSYDITRPQPQLFVAPSFEMLTDALEAYSKTMAYQRGGIEGLSKAILARTVTSTALNSGLQVSGKLTRFHTSSDGSPCYLQYEGPTQLAYEGRELENHGPTYHNQGFGMPMGRLTYKRVSPCELNDEDLKKLGFVDQKRGVLEFESGVKLEGRLKYKLSRKGLNILMGFEECKVTRGDEILFDPSWGTYDMGCGIEVTSVFGGPADRTRYLEATGGYKQVPGKQKTNFSEKDRELYDLYARIRQIRDQIRGAKELDEQAIAQLKEVRDKLSSKYSGEWLLRLELLELAAGFPAIQTWVSELSAELNRLKAHSKTQGELIQHGMALLLVS